MSSPHTIVSAVHEIPAERDIVTVFKEYIVPVIGEFDPDAGFDNTEKEKYMYGEGEFNGHPVLCN